MNKILTLLLTPEFYDIFGIIVFLFIILYAHEALKAKGPLPKWANLILLGIGIVGLIVDLFNVNVTYSLA